jgi:hypothetical protein
MSLIHTSRTPSESPLLAGWCHLSSGLVEPAHAPAPRHCKCDGGPWMREVQPSNEVMLEYRQMGVFHPAPLVRVIRQKSIYISGVKHVHDHACGLWVGERDDDDSNRILTICFVGEGRTRSHCCRCRNRLRGFCLEASASFDSIAASLCLENWSCFSLGTTLTTSNCFSHSSALVLQIQQIPSHLSGTSCFLTASSAVKDWGLFLNKLTPVL